MNKSDVFSTLCTIVNRRLKNAGISDTISSRSLSYIEENFNGQVLNASGMSLLTKAEQQEVVYFCLLGRFPDPAAKIQLSNDTRSQADYYKHLLITWHNAPEYHQRCWPVKIVGIAN